MALTKAKASNILLTTPAASSNDVTPATTEYVTTALANMVDSAPSTLNTLNELAAALGDDANFSTTVTNSIAGKLPLAGGTMTGHILLNNAVELRSKDTSSNIKTITRINSSNELEYGWSGSGPVKFMGGGAYTERMRIHTNGNIGIGNSSPKARTSTWENLQIGERAAFYSQASGTTGISENIYYNSGFKAIANDVSTVYQQDSGNHQFYTGASASADAAVTLTERVRIDPDGHVAFKTTDLGYPDYGDDLTIADSGHCGMTIRSGTSSNGTLYFSDDTGTAGGTYAGKIAYEHANNRMLFATDTQNRMAIDSDGKVGIGTISPDQTLTVSSSSAIAGKFLGEGGPHGLFIGGNDAGFGYIGHVSSGSYDLAIDSSGKVGIGHSSPAAELHVNKTNAGGLGGRLLIQNSSSTSGSYCQLIMAPTAATADTRCVVIQAENTDGNNNQSMVFKTSPGAAPVERMRIDYSGDVSVSANTDGNEFRVNSTGSGGNDAGLSTKLPGYNSNIYSNFFSTGNNIYFVLAGSYVGYIAGNGNYYPTDSRLKKDVTDLSGSLDKIKQLRGVNFKWIDERTDGNNIGFIAQEVESVIPEVVGDGGLPNTEDGEAPMKNVSYEHIVPHLVEAIKELEARVKELEG
mgnify:FL=1